MLRPKDYIKCQFASLNGVAYDERSRLKSNLETFKNQCLIKLKNVLNQIYLSHSNFDFFTLPNECTNKSLAKNKSNFKIKLALENIKDEISSVIKFLDNAINYFEKILSCPDTDKCALIMNVSKLTLKQICEVLSKNVV